MTITADAVLAQREILARMERTLEVGARRSSVAAHTGRGGGSETAGHCPVILVDTTVTYEQVPDGISVHIRAADPLEAGVVQGRVESRARALELQVPRS